MLYSVKDLGGHKIEALDGRLGKPYEFCFDDRTWQLRYTVVETGDWLQGNKVLIAMDRLGPLEPEKGELPIALTLQQIQDSPSIDTDQPVYLQEQINVYDYTGWGGEMQAAGAWWISPLAAQLMDQAAEERAQECQRFNPHLRSTREVMGYHIEAIDGEIGHVADFIVDDQTWQISHIVVDTRNWLSGDKVLIVPEQIVKVAWAERQVYVDVQRDMIERGPEFDLEALRRESVASNLAGDGSATRKVANLSTAPSPLRIGK